jgi:hypothetical protein
MQHTTQHSTVLLETMTVVQLVTKLLTFMNPESSVPYTQQPVSQYTSPPGPTQSTPSHTISLISLAISGFPSHLHVNVPHSPFQSIYWLKFYIHLSTYVGETSKMHTWWIFDRASWYRIEIFTTNLMHNFLYSTIVSYHAPLHVSSVTALILRGTLYIRSIWFSHALYAAIRGTD